MSTRKIREYPQSPFSKLKRTDRILLQEISGGCVLIEREGTFYKHKLPEDAVNLLLMILNGELSWYDRGKKTDYDPE